MELIFNELSHHIASDKETALQQMKIFADVIKEAHQAGITTLRINFRFQRLELSHGYLIEEWFNDRHHVSEETRGFIQSLTTAFQYLEPFDKDVADEDIQSKKDIIITCFGKDAEGLAYAHLLKGIALSFLSDPQWDQHNLPITITELLDDADDFSTKEETIKHLARSDHIFLHQDWINERKKDSIVNGRGLLTNVKDWYPHLIFCNDAKKQIRKLPKGRELERVIDRLSELENYCKNWSTGGFNGVGIKNSSGESTLTMQQYGREREFVCPDGKPRTFEYHLKGLYNAWRIHIWADEQREFELGPSGNRKILIGYIGKHLSTANDPT